MTCDEYRLALSAELDGEPLGIPALALRAHVVACPACTAWLAAAQRVTRLTRVAPADDIPDVSDAVINQLAGQPRPRMSRRTLARVCRFLLAVTGIAQAALAFPSLLGHDSMHATMHVAHEIGAWNAALAVGFGWVAFRPQRAAGLLPALSTFVILLFGLSLPDLVNGHVQGSRVSNHFLAVAGLVLLVLLARLQPRQHSPSGRSEQYPTTSELEYDEASWSTVDTRQVGHGSHPAAHTDRKGVA